MDTPKCETWHFTTHAGPADQVFLATDGPATASRWIQMHPVPGEPGKWSVNATFLPGRHRLRYFTIDNGTTLNCGSIGLVGERTSSPNSAVQIEDMMSLAASA